MTKKDYEQFAKVFRDVLSDMNEGMFEGGYAVRQVIMADDGLISEAESGGAVRSGG